MKRLLLPFILFLIGSALAQSIKDTGSENRTTSERGRRETQRREIANSLKTMENRSLIVSVNIIPIFYRHFPIRVEVHKYFKYPLSGKGVVYTSQVEYYRQASQVKDRADELYNTDLIKRDMENLIRFAVIVKDTLERLKIAGTLGIQDIERVASSIDYDRPINIPFSLSECYVWDIYTVRCGDCVYDFSEKMGIPEIVCKGLKVISGDSVMGYGARLEVSQSSSIEEIFSKASTHEEFKSVASAYISYTKNSSTSAVDDLTLKSLLLRNYAQGRPQLHLAESMMRRGEPPSKLIGTLRSWVK